MSRSTLRSGESSASSPVFAVISILLFSFVFNTTLQPSTTPPSRTDRSVQLKWIHSARQRRRSLVLELDDVIASDVLEMYLLHAGPIPSRPRSKTSHRRPQVHPPLHTEWVVDAFSRARQWLNIPFARIVMKCRDYEDGLFGARGAGLGLGVSVQWTNRQQ